MHRNGGEKYGCTPYLLLISYPFSLILSLPLFLHKYLLKPCYVPRTFPGDCFYIVRNQQILYLITKQKFKCIT